MNRNIIALSILAAIVLNLLSPKAHADGRITYRENIQQECKFLEVDDSPGLYKLVFKSTQGCIDALKTAESHRWSPMADCSTYGGPGEMYLACTELLHPVWKQMYHKLPSGICRTPVAIVPTEERRTRGSFGWFWQCPQSGDGTTTLFCATFSSW
jgi:hypothetical protein